MSSYQCVACLEIKDELEYSYGSVLSMEQGYNKPMICEKCLFGGAQRQDIIDQLDIDKGFCPECKNSFNPLQSKTKFGRRCPHCGVNF